MQTVTDSGRYSPDGRWCLTMDAQTYTVREEAAVFVKVTTVKHGAAELVQCLPLKSHHTNIVVMIYITI